MKKLTLLIVLAVLCTFLIQVTQENPVEETPILLFKQMGDVGRVSFSLNGTLLMALSYSLDEAAVFSVDGEELLKVEANESALMRGAALDPREELVAVSFADLLEEPPKGWIAVYSISNGTELWHISKVNAKGAERVAFSEDGRYLAALWIEGEGDHREAVVAVYTRGGELLWEEVVSEEEGIIKGELAVTSEGVVAAVGEKLVFLSFNGSQLWECKLPFSVEELAVSRGGLIAAAGHSQFCLLDADGKLLWSKHFGALIFTLDMSSNGEFIVVGGWRGAKAYTSSGEELWSYQHGEECITPAAISSEGYAVVVDNSKYQVRALLISSEGVILWEEELPNIGVGGCADIAEDASLVAVGGWGLYLLKGKEYVEAAKPLAEKPPITITPSSEEHVLWTLNTTDDLEAVHITEKGAVLIETEGWIHLVSGNGTLLWSKPYGPPLEAAISHDGGLIAVVTGKQVILLNREGEERWKLALEDNVKALTFIDEERLAAVALGRLYLLSLDGEVKSTVDLECPSMPQKPFYIGAWPWLAIASSKGILAVAFSTEQSAVTVVEGGAVKWTLELDKPVMSLFLAGKALFLGLGNGTLVALSVDDGQPLWKVVLEEAPLLSVAASSENFVVTASKEGFVYGVDSGKLLWKYPEKPEEHEYYVQVAVSENGQLVAAAGSHLAILASTGQLLWKQKLPEAEKAVEKLLAATPDLNIIAVITSKNTMHCYSFEQPQKPEAAPTPSGLFTGWLIAAVCIAALAAVTALKMRKR